VTDRVEIRDGKEYRVTVLPPGQRRKEKPVKPVKKREPTSYVCSVCNETKQGRPAKTRGSRAHTFWRTCHSCFREWKRTRYQDDELDRDLQAALDRDGEFMQ
jgi:hypothetical protein